jgi:hypothetical protein
MTQQRDVNKVLRILNNAQPLSARAETLYVLTQQQRDDAMDILESVDARETRKDPRLRKARR